MLKFCVKKFSHAVCGVFWGVRVESGSISLKLKFVFFPRTPKIIIIFFFLNDDGLFTIADNNLD